MEIDLNIVQGKVIKSAYFLSEVNSNGYDSIIFLFNNFALIIKPNIDTDELNYSLLNKKVKFKNKLHPRFKNCKELIGKSFFSIWEGTNNKGYSDLILFALNDFIPDFGITCIASTLYTFNTSENTRNLNILENHKNN